jgi:dTDP-L-rhamnose 4-epimerase
MPANGMAQVVIIGGAGFIGSHLADALLGRGFRVRVVDSLDRQVHPSALPPAYLNPQAEFLKQDVRDRAGLCKALAGAEAIFHLAGAVGVGDSMYKIQHYAEANVLGAANLLDILANEKHSVRKVVLASSVTIYGEGKYSCPQHGIIFPSMRGMEQAAKREWELRCQTLMGSAKCGKFLQPMATDEAKPATPGSVYAITKRTQEEMFLAVGSTYGIPVTVLRYFNVYGTRQAISNPYTGVAKIFALRIAQGKAPVIYEDGLQTRDFVHVHDVARANLLALESEEANGEIFNVGTGRATSILELARTLAKQLGSDVTIEPSFKCRAGDVRHCWADINKIRNRLGFEPRTLLPAGLRDIIEIVNEASGCEQSGSEHNDLARRGLIS